MPAHILTDGGRIDGEDMSVWTEGKSLQRTRPTACGDADIQQYTTDINRINVDMAV
jgi:hypothetical protein